MLRTLEWWAYKRQPRPNCDGNMEICTMYIDMNFYHLCSPLVRGAWAQSAIQFHAYGVRTSYTCEFMQFHFALPEHQRSNVEHLSCLERTHTLPTKRCVCDMHAQSKILMLITLLHCSFRRWLNARVFAATDAAATVLCARIHGSSAWSSTLKLYAETHDTKLNCFSRFVLRPARLLCLLTQIRGDGQLNHCIIEAVRRTTKTIWTLEHIDECQTHTNNRIKIPISMNRPKSRSSTEPTARIMATTHDTHRICFDLHIFDWI